MENLKNMIVLKNLPSNIIDEAFVILKPNNKLIKEYYIKNKGENNASREDINKSNYILREAECVITDYITTLEKRNQKDFNLEKKYTRLKIFTITLTIISVILAVV